MFPSIEAAVAANEPGTAHSYRPQPKSQAVYDRLYAIWRGLHDVLGRERVDLLHGLKQIRLQEGAQDPSTAPIAQGSPA
jgi:hypothetical protein